MRPSRGPGQRAGLSRAAVLAAARELLTEDGVAALSMRALARRLGVAPNSLYSHVRNKEELLDELLDDVLAAVEVPDADDPAAGLTALMTSTYEVLTAHPDLVPLYLARQGARGPHAVRLGEVVDVLLARAGVPAVADARRALIVHAIGSAAFATGAPGIGRPLADAEARQGFDRSLRWLLAGILFAEGTVGHATRTAPPAR